ncbi:hypothetical protein ABBQ38_008805 [Trebouxia sp. C0009 RCD-2024]
MSNQCLSKDNKALRNRQPAGPHLGTMSQCSSALHSEVHLLAHRPFRPSTRRHPAPCRKSIRTRAGPVKEAERPASDAATKTLNEGIAKFYDESSGLWESMWGEHMHHGYYPKDGPSKSNLEAQIDMIDESLRWAGIDQATEMVDVGCGIGGSSRHIAKKFGCRAEGITLSPVQAARANSISQSQGLGSKVNYQVADALHQPFRDGQFDLIWSMESGEHMPDKAQFIKELTRVCKPGGKILIVTWCHRNLQPGEAKLKDNEEALLDSICKAYYLPKWCSVNDYEELCKANGLQGIRTADWSEEVAPFWGAVIKSALSAQGFMGLFKAGITTIKVGRQPQFDCVKGHQCDKIS